MSKAVSHIASGLLVLLAIVAALITYKTSSALSAIDHASSAGTLALRAGVVPLVAPTELSVIARSLNYLTVIWPALVFGVLISAGVRAFVPPTAFSGFFGNTPFRAQLVAGASGSPLMLCSCCVAPLFSTVYERSARLGPSLALMVAAPALNPAAVILTFMLFSLPIAGARVVMSVVAVFVGTALVARIGGSQFVTVNVPSPALASREAADPLLVRFVRSFSHVAVRTVPVLIIGVFAGMAISGYLPAVTFTSWPARTLVIAVIAAIAVPIALPTFFEIPLAAALLGAGAPAGAAAALLFAGPAVNLPSLLTVARSAGWVIAAALAVMIWIVAVGGALLVS